MTRVINTKNTKPDDLQLATDQECVERRRLLINAGIINPSHKDSVIAKKNSAPVINTIQYGKNLRQFLIKSGIINVDLCYIEPSKHKCSANDQGEYKTKVIDTDEEYNRRKQIYFKVMQEMLCARRDLKLILGPKKEDDPDWYF